MRYPRLLGILVGVLTLATVTLVAPAPAQAASRCSTGSATGGAGGYWATSGPFVADDTSTSTGAEIPNYGWPVEDVDQAEVWVCLGNARPGYGSEDRCSLITYVEYYE
ncbi:hypothetical protein OOJ91_03600 [Micromonospora lupini]|uniref:hypothetical protein n=1 Tax=Micromonospora lupini TaxID=285679 RepID=UPI002254DA55|nr:hypothetical protein [Micromonospora lupini]MCX5064959.1 hypothetical protein [Micromonospora lupini]